MTLYEVEQATELLDELLDRTEAGEEIGLTRKGKLVAWLLPPLEENTPSTAAF